MTRPTDLLEYEFLEDFAKDLLIDLSHYLSGQCKEDCTYCNSVEQLLEYIQQFPGTITFDSSEQTLFKKITKWIANIKYGRTEIGVPYGTLSDGISWESIDGSGIISLIRQTMEEDL